MVKIIDKNKSRIRRHKRVRSKITGTQSARVLTFSVLLSTFTLRSLTT